MTNSPKYDWHLTNLRNYVNLNAENVPPVVIEGISFAGTGQGTGLKGIPGDPTPPSRFVRAAEMAYLSQKGDTAADIVNLSEHILNNVDIPIGLVRDFENGEPIHRPLRRRRRWRYLFLAANALRALIHYNPSPPLPISADVLRTARAGMSRELPVSCS